MSKEHTEQRRTALITAECDECGQTFNLAKPYDSKEWSLAHDCEEGTA